MIFLHVHKIKHFVVKQPVVLQLHEPQYTLQPKAMSFNLFHSSGDSAEEAYIYNTIISRTNLCLLACQP